MGGLPRNVAVEELNSHPDKSVGEYLENLLRLS
jgi:hypothetical protein